MAPSQGTLAERWVASTATQVHESALGEEDEMATGSHGEAVDLRLDVDSLDGVLLQPSDINLDIEVTDAAIHQPDLRAVHSQLTCRR